MGKEDGPQSLFNNLLKHCIKIMEAFIDIYPVLTVVGWLGYLLNNFGMVFLQSGLIKKQAPVKASQSPFQIGFKKIMRHHCVKKSQKWQWLFVIQFTEDCRTTTIASSNKMLFQWWHDVIIGLIFKLCYWQLSIISLTTISSLLFLQMYVSRLLLLYVLHTFRSSGATVSSLFFFLLLSS